MNKKIIFAAGGTGGHILPAISLMKYLSDKKYNVLLITDERGKKYINKENKFEFNIIRAETYTNKNFFKKISALLRVFISILKSIFLIKKEKLDLVIGFGGYVSFPTMLASKLLMIPLVIYENNVILGRANKFLSYFSSQIFTAKDISKNLPKKIINKAHKVGSIINMGTVDQQTIKKNNDFFSILVLGGSQGAEVFGNIIPQVIKKLEQNGYKIKIIQQCISSQLEIIKNFYKKNNIENYIFVFDKNISNLIYSSDVAITRCGASATAELVYALKPFIAVPLPGSLDNHQFLNAKYYENKGYCWLLEQDKFNFENLFNLIVETINNKNKLEDIKKNMKKEHKNNACEEVEKKIRELLEK